MLNLPTGTHNVRAARRHGDIQSVQIQVTNNMNTEYGFMFSES